MKIARVTIMLILGAIGAIPLVLLTPPFQVPDEVQHFYRAYQLSEFQIRAEVRNGVSGGTLPDSLPKLVKSSVYTRDDIFYPATPAPIIQTLRLASIPLDNSARHFVSFPGSAFYSPLPYFPQVLGIALGRFFGLGPLYLLYLGRLFNCLAALALVGFAVYWMPIAAELVMLVGLLPMSLFLYASLSPDASVISCALLFTALSFSASSEGNWKTWELTVASIAAAVFCSVKPVYAPLVLAGIVPGVLKKTSTATVIRAHAILAGVALGAAAGWLLFAKSSMTTLLGGGHPSLQLPYILHNPTSFMRALAHAFSFREILVRYIEAVGEFGWLTVPLWPFCFYLLPFFNFLIVWRLAARGGVARSTPRGLWYLTLALLSTFLILTAIYLMCAQLGQTMVPGVQGRYFIPLLVLAGMAAIYLAPGRLPSLARRRNLALVTAVIAVQIAAMDATIIRAFHVF